VIGLAHEEELHAQMRPFYLRRLKTDSKIKMQLPEKTYTTLWVDLDPAQRRAYDQMKRHMIAWVGEQDQEEPVAAPVVIAQLMRLQQFAGAYAYLEGYLRKNKHTGQMDPAQRVRLCEPSSKLDEVMNLIENNPDEPMVVFSQSKQMIDMLYKRLADKGISTSIITGDVPMGDRDGVVQDFQEGRTRIFAGTIAAGGTGITLTRASTVVFLDRAWNTAANRQAEDRLHRIGQRNPVQIIDIVARNTVDLGRLQRLQLKWSWIARILGDPASEQKWIDVPELTQHLEDYT
jgi:SNF2 family DNA or RNA helicase